MFTKQKTCDPTINIMLEVVTSILGSEDIVSIKRNDNQELLGHILLCMESFKRQIPFDLVVLTRNFVSPSLKRTDHGHCSFQAVGNFTGGELQIMTEFFDINCKIVFFDSNVLHAHRPFRGTKIGILTCTQQSVPRVRTSFHICISIISRDLGHYNTSVIVRNGTQTQKIELPYKHKGLWALRIQDYSISDKVLLDTYFSRNADLMSWADTIYTVSDTSCAAGRPIFQSFYDKVKTKGLDLPCFEYRQPLVFVLSQRFGNFCMIGNRRVPFLWSLYMKGDHASSCLNQCRYNSASEITFD